MSATTTKGKRAGPYEVLSDEEKAVEGEAANKAFHPPSLESGNGKKKGRETETPAPPYELLDVRALLSYVEQPGEVLCGDAVLEVGEFAMLFGFPSVGKSWAIMDLMAKAAWGRGRWLGHEIKCPFATLWIGDENNKRRLSNQLKSLHAAGLLPDDFEKWIFITDVPETMDVGDAAFVAHTRRIVEEKGIKLVILDTVSSAVVDETAKDFSFMFRGMKAINYGLSVRPCWMLVHHRRKPKSEDTEGNGRLHAISGHQVLRRKPRTIIELERVTEQSGDRRVVATLLKNSNGKSEGEKHALQQTDRGFDEIENFDFSECAGGGGGAGGHNEKITEKNIRELFDNGSVRYAKGDAVRRLMKLAECKDKAAYAALSGNGRFAHLLKIEGKEIGMEAAPWEEAEQ
jgi:hypothetical protein